MGCPRNPCRRAWWRTFRVWVAVETPFLRLANMCRTRLYRKWLMDTGPLGISALRLVRLDSSVVSMLLVLVGPYRQP